MGRWRLGVKGVSIKEKGLMGKDSSVVVAGGRGYKGTKWYCEKYNKD